MENNTNSRRSFLKKAAYTAPALVGLGTLVAPTVGSASSRLAGTAQERYNHQLVTETRHTLGGETFDVSRVHWDDFYANEDAHAGR